MTTLLSSSTSFCHSCPFLSFPRKRESTVTFILSVSEETQYSFLFVILESTPTVILEIFYRGSIVIIILEKRTNCHPQKPYNCHPQLDWGSTVTVIPAKAGIQCLFFSLFFSTRIRIQFFLY